MKIMKKTELSMNKVFYNLGARSLTTQLTVVIHVLIDFSLTVKAATLIFIPGRGSAISPAKHGKSGFVCNLINN